MKTTMKDLLLEQSYAEKAGNLESSNGSDNKQIERHELVEGTPFWAHINIANKEYFLSYGKFQITEIQTYAIDPIQEIYNYLNGEQYNIICKMILCTIQDKLQHEPLYGSVKPTLDKLEQSLKKPN